MQRQVVLAAGHVGELDRHHLAGIQVDHVHAPLGVLPHLLVVALGPALGRVEGDHPGVIVVRAIHRPGAQPEYQPDHAGRGVDQLVPGIGVLGQPHAGDLGKKVILVTAARYPLHQQRHLLVPV